MCYNFRYQVKFLKNNHIFIFFYIIFILHTYMEHPLKLVFRLAIRFLSINRGHYFITALPTNVATKLDDLSSYSVWATGDHTDKQSFIDCAVCTDWADLYFIYSLYKLLTIHEYITYTTWFQLGIWHFKMFVNICRSVWEQISLSVHAADALNPAKVQYI